MAALKYIRIPSYPGIQDKPATIITSSSHTPTVARYVGMDVSVIGSGGRENQISQGTMNASNVFDLFKSG